MRFLLHGQLPPDTSTALEKHEHHAHTLDELAESSPTAREEITADPQILLALLQKKQWNLLTADADLVQKIYEQKIAFPAIIVLILTEAPNLTPIDRLFERYPRLTPRRLYTVTPSRVKIRQLPGAAQA